MREIKMKRFIVLGVIVGEGDTEAAEEGQFDTKEEAEALIAELSEDGSACQVDDRFHFYFMDLWPNLDPHKKGGHN